MNDLIVERSSVSKRPLSGGGRTRTPSSTVASTSLGARWQECAHVLEAECGSPTGTAYLHESRMIQRYWTSEPLTVGTSSSGTIVLEALTALGCNYIVSGADAVTSFDLSSSGSVTTNFGRLMRQSIGAGSAHVRDGAYKFKATVGRGDEYVLQAFDRLVQENQFIRERASAIAKVRSYANIGASADDEPAISDAARDKGIALLKAIELPLKIPHVSCSTDGELIFNWLYRRQRLEASIDDDLHLVWAIDRGAYFEAGADIDLNAIDGSVGIDKAAVGFFASLATFLS